MIHANQQHGHKLFISAEGSSGAVGLRLAASLTSIGVSSQFVPPIEWNHGDLGHLAKGDCVLLISHSGRNEDVLKLIDLFRKRGVVVLGMCGNRGSPLLHKVDAVGHEGESDVGIVRTGQCGAVELYSDEKCCFAGGSGECVGVAGVLAAECECGRFYSKSPVGRSGELRGEVRKFGFHLFALFVPDS